MLETVREFALESLDANGETGPIAAAHAAQMVAFAEAAEPHLLGPDEGLWLDRCEAELGNLRAALAWTLEHDPDVAVRIAASLWLFWNWYRLEEGRTWLQRALAQAQRRGDTPDHTLARGYTTCTALAVLSGDAADARELGELAVDAAAATGDRALEGLARWVLTTRNLLEPEFDRSGPGLDRALPLMSAGKTTSVRAQTAYATSHRGVAAFSSGGVSEGMAYYERALSLARVAGSRAMLLVILGDYAGWCVEFGDNGRAHELAVEALALARDESLWAVGSPLSCLALLAATNGQPKLAAGLLGAIDAAVANTGLAIPKHFVRRLDRARDLAGTQLGDLFPEAHAAGMANPRQLMADAAAQMERLSLFSKRPTSPQLSPRQVDVLRLIVAGRSDRQIAEDLFISHRTVSSHVAAILNKLDASSRSEVAVRAVREGLI